MKKTVSLNRNTMFLRLYSKGTSCANKYLAVYFLKTKNPDGIRLGITVSKKVGCAVVRNRIKRLIRESYRLNEDKIKSGIDIVIVARRNAAEASYKSISSALLHLLKKLSLMETDHA